MMLIVDVVQDGEENGAPGGGFNQAEDNSQVLMLMLMHFSRSLLLNADVRVLELDAE